MHRFRRHRDVIALVAALVLPLGTAAIFVPFRSSFANTASALVLVAVIVAVAVAGNRFTGLVATVSATLCSTCSLPVPREARHLSPPRHRNGSKPVRCRRHRDRAGGAKPAPL